MSAVDSTTRLVKFAATTGEWHIERVSNTLAAVLMTAGLAVDPVIEGEDEG